MAKKFAVVKADKALLAAVSYTEQDGYGEYTATELERQDKANEKALSALDRRYAQDKEYDGTNFAKLRKDAMAVDQDPNERWHYYKDKETITKKGTILTGRGKKSFWLRVDGEKKPFLIIGGEDVITIGVDLPKKMPAPSGIEFLMLCYKNIGSLIIKGATKEIEVSFVCAKESRVWFGKRTTDPIKKQDTADEVNFG